VGGGLGIHATNDLAGCARFGPDVEWTDRIDYSFDGTRKDDFAVAIRSYFPSIDANKLQPAYTGIRPKLSKSGKSVSDFSIQGEGQHGISQLVNLFGIESPGLTASLAIANYVERILA
jgi:L-2-hydroxyglutarate oxidase LhgO